MAITTINVGAAANDGTGDTPRAAGQKINTNFTDSTNAASKLVVSNSTDTTADRVVTTGYDVKGFASTSELATAGSIMSVGGTGDAIELTSLYTGAATSYITGSEFEFTAIANSTVGTPTVDIDGLGAVTLNSFIVTGERYRIKYNGISFDVLSDPIEGAAAVRDANGTFKVGAATDPEHPYRLSDLATDKAAFDVYGRENILGTVSKSGGVPTGAIIERGSNVNGEYVKFADGTQICLLNITVTDQAIENTYGILYLGARIWTFPSSFISPPAVPAPAIQLGTSASWGMSNGDSSHTAASLRVLDIVPRAYGTSTRIQAIAIGRWY